MDSVTILGTDEFVEDKNLFEPEVVEEPTVFERGQVWYWDDPIYGRKEDGRKVASFEGSIRYSRYVVIAQHDDSVANDILVIPLSTKTKNKYDVHFEIMNQIHNLSATNARSMFICPVSKDSLKRYVCKLPSKDIDLVTFRVMQLIMPKRVSEYIGDALSSYYDIDISLKEIEYQKNQSVEDNYEEEDEDDHNTNNAVIWTDKAKEVFIHEYETKGTEYVSGKYNIKQNTAKRYYKKYLHDLDTDVELSVSNIDPDHVTSGCSKFSSYVRKILRQENANLTYITIGKNSKTGKNFTRFYDLVNSALYSSLTEFIINPNTHKVNLNHTNTLLFMMEFKRLCCVEDTLKEITPIELMTAYKHEYGETFGINKEWIPLFRDKLRKKMKSMHCNTDKLVKDIADRFCEE